ncbi:Lcl C-terminal domain-containing protein [Flammeovirga aprica]|nr:DUF1566 domain-containing protein [Flammeovirga aprica]
MKKSIFKLSILTGLLAFMTFSFTSCSQEDEIIEDTEENPEAPGNNLPDISGYPVVGTNQTTFFNNSQSTTTQAEGDNFFGQNANYLGNEPSYTDNNDGTVTDNVTGLMWQQSFDHDGDGTIDVNDKLTYSEILALVENGFTYAGYSDWRVPTIKEMYSLILYSGKDIAPESTSGTDLTPFIDNNTFEFAYGDVSAGERLIDMQCATTNVYVSKEVETLVFGVNFADGRIKGYGTRNPHGSGDKAFNYLLVRGNATYGQNDYTDNGDGTVTDKATGLMWSTADNAEAVLWQDALKYAENNELAGHTDWRLPDAKELQSIVDYDRSPATHNSASIDPVFECTKIINEREEEDFPWYWSSTTHESMANQGGGSAVYVAFGRSLGNMNGWIDIHGAGSQRSDPKTGDPADYEEGFGPQGDAIRIYNYVRLVRTVE